MVRYAFESCGNSQYGKVHLSVKIPDMPWLGSTKDVGHEGVILKRALESIEGIVEAYGGDYSVTIQRGGVFTFSELLPKVLEVLRVELNLGDELEEVSPYQ